MDYDSFYSVMHRSGVAYKKKKEKEASEAKRINDDKLCESDAKDSGASAHHVESDSKAHYSDEKSSK